MPLNCRFQTTFLGSRALVGTLLQPTNLLQSKGADGLSVTQVLQQHGYGPTHEAISSIAMRPNQVNEARDGMLSFLICARACMTSPHTVRLKSWTGTHSVSSQRPQFGHL